MKLFLAAFNSLLIFTCRRHIYWCQTSHLIDVCGWSVIINFVSSKSKSNNLQSSTKVQTFSADKNTVFNPGLTKYGRIRMHTVSQLQPHAPLTQCFLHRASAEELRKSMCWLCDTRGEIQSACSEKEDEYGKDEGGACLRGKAKQKWKSQQCREPEWGSKILCWQNYWPQYCTQILEGGKKKNLTRLLLERRSGLHMQLHKCTIGSQEVWYKHIYLHTGLRWVVVATQLDVSTHARSLSPSLTHKNTQRLQGQASDIFRPPLVPKEVSIPLSSPCASHLTGLGRERETFLLCLHSKDFLKSTFGGGEAGLIVNNQNNKKFVVI